ncbi:hypothetical protein [Trinickia symbiotica]|uniref:hypothetical protein n=1 Tax=Trinickia symbiotica TaxID=863227 RepID=UPI001CB945FB|nr:hypothetical protein [Trinickia symbiotica]
MTESKRIATTTGVRGRAIFSRSFSWEGGGQSDAEFKADRLTAHLLAKKFPSRQAAIGDDR